MLKYSTLVVAEKDWDENENLISTGKKFIDFQGFEYSGLSKCTPGQNEKETINENFKELIAFYMESRIVIPVPHGDTELPPGYVYHEVDWQTELRIRVSNALIPKKMEHISKELVQEGVFLDQQQVEQLFDPFRLLDLCDMLEVIRIFRLPFTVEEVKFKYE